MLEAKFEIRELSWAKAANEYVVQMCSHWGNLSMNIEVNGQMWTFSVTRFETSGDFFGN